MATTAQDILILLPHLSKTDSKKLYDATISADVLSCKDNGVQKRGYKILSKLFEGNQIDEDAEVVLKKLDEMIEGLSAAAKKVCLSKYCPCLH